jgi:tetratricopeptide (TPR) repeat protein
VRERLDYWMPALFTRLEGDSIFAQRVIPWTYYGFASLGVLLIATIALFIWSNNRVKPMGKGFNVAVAEFTVQDESGGYRSTKEGMQISQDLYLAITNQLQELPAALTRETRGPEMIKTIRGATPAERDLSAQETARRNNATILVYGVISYKDGHSQLEPSFYVSDNSFRYGGEVRGSQRLSRPIPIDLNQDNGPILPENVELYTRTVVLQRLVIGLANFFIGDYDRAALDFKQAAGLPGWNESDGKEVAYMLLGSALLRGYIPCAEDTTPLEQALQAFEKAREINPDYARAYLGLGSATLLKANRFDPNQKEELKQAQQWLEDALRASDQPETAYVPVKVAYELGQVHQLGADQGFANFSQDLAKTSFNQVIEDFNQAGRPPELTWYDGHARLYLGRMKGISGDWVGMEGECRLALEELKSLNSLADTIKLASARAWSCIGRAQENQNQPTDALESMKQAIQIGCPVACSVECDFWKERKDELQKEINTLQPTP